MINDEIEKKVDEILSSCNVKKYPILIKKIVTAKGLHLKPYDMGEEISGVLVVESDKSTIGFNTKESEVRQRFSIAHELGHYTMHREHSALFLDKKMPMILYRDQSSSTGEKKWEQDANAFAAAILMPIPFLKKEIKSKDIKSFDEPTLLQLARAFNVSLAAMTIRISNLLAANKLV